MSTLTGRRLGVYQIQAHIGAGGMGEVYRARDSRLGRDVAIKVLPAIFTADTVRLARFEREARLLAALNHPNIGAIYGFEEADDVRALVLELVEGETLAGRIARGRLPLKETLIVARGIAEALDAAHEKGIIHRDLKPSNIKITPDGVVKVLDFGLAKAADEGPGTDISQSPTVTIGGTREGIVLGTAAYMSPEQARGQAVDKRTDIWAFGCVVYEMLAGRAAFARETISDTIVAILEQEPDWSLLPSVTPAATVRLLHQCLEKDPRRRQRDIGDALSEIEDAQRTRIASPEGLVAKTQRQTPTRLAWSALGALGAIAIMFPFLRPADDAWENPLESAQFTRLTDFEGAEVDPRFPPMEGSSSFFRIAMDQWTSGSHRLAPESSGT